MAEDLLTSMRQLRTRAEHICRTVVEDYRPFVDPRYPAFFFRLPSSPPSGSKPVSITPTLTAWMSLAMAEKLASVIKVDKKSTLRDGKLQPSASRRLPPIARP